MQMVRLVLALAWIASISAIVNFPSRQRLVRSSFQGLNGQGPSRSQRSHFESLSSTRAGVEVEDLGKGEQQDGSLATVGPPWLPSFVTAALGGALFGSDIGTSSSVVRILGEGTSSLGQLSSLEIGQLASVSLGGAVAASASLILIGDKNLGRKDELKIASVLYLVGTLAQSLSPSFATIIVGRIIYGLGIGTAMHVAPLYIAETAPSSLRGKLVSLKEAAIVAGIIAGYLAGAALGDSSSSFSFVDVENWRQMFLTALPLEAMMVAGAFFITSESPRWLALRGRKEDAEQALIQCQGVDIQEAEDQVAAMIQATSQSKVEAGSVDEDDDSVVGQLKEIFGSPYNKRALYIGVGLVLLQQLSGQPSVLYYANRIFEKAGLGYEAAVGVGVFKLAMTIISSFLVENPKFGRRSLLLYGNIGVTASLTALTALYGFAGPDGPNTNAIIACILSFVGSYQIGFGPITWLILSEIFPLRIRSAAVSMGTLANFGSNLLVALAFETEREYLGETALFGQFALIAALATAFTVFSVFETRGLTLEEIELKLREVVDGGEKEE